MGLPFYKGRRVLVTGHTGFKGLWLAIWLEALGARVTGLGLPPTTEMLAGWPGLVGRILGDLCDLKQAQRAFEQVEPEVVFHLAARALVRESYRDPVGTFAANVMGTTHVLEAARHAPSVRSIVVITTDKVYANREWCWGYRENDELGGRDPYSASKGCAELVAGAYRASFRREDEPLPVATARAGNVIGGGDWAEDRLVPDMVRGIAARRPIVIRRPTAVRPWQHVLEPLDGYLRLGAALASNARAARAWNFGPSESMTVGALARRFTSVWGEGDLRLEPSATGPHEAGLLKLDSALALCELGWRPLLSAEERVDWTVEWYRAWRKAPSSVWDWTARQIERYEERMADAQGQGRLAA